MCHTRSIYLYHPVTVSSSSNRELQTGSYLKCTNWTEVPPKKLSFRFRISLSDMTNYKSADF